MWQGQGATAARARTTAANNTTWKPVAKATATRAMPILLRMAAIDTLRRVYTFIAQLLTQQ